MTVENKLRRAIIENMPATKSSEWEMEQMEKELDL